MVEVEPGTEMVEVTNWTCGTVMVVSMVAYVVLPGMGAPRDSPVV
jgi:hypothetical protein